MKNIHVKLTDNSIQKFSKGKAEDALLQVIWNAIDAKATEIKINLIKDKSGINSDEIPLNTIEKIEVIDNGCGIDNLKVGDYFSQHETSWKKGRKRSDGREYQGKNGVGRFKYFALGKTIKWFTTHKTQDSFFSYNMIFNYNNPQNITPTVEKENKNKSGTKVVISNLTEKAKALNENKYKEIIIQGLSLYIKNNLGKFKVFINGKIANPDEYIDKLEKGKFIFEDEGQNYVFNYEFIAWKKGFDFNKHKHTFIYDKSLNYKDFFPSGIQTGNYLPFHTVFLISDYYNDYDSFHDNFNKKFPQIIKLYKNKLTSFLFKIKQSRAKEIFNDFTEKDFYPFPEATNNIITESEKNLFDLCAFSILENNPKLFSNKKSSLTLLFKLLRRFIEKDEHIADNLSEILNLDSEKALDFKRVCKSSKLPNIITHYKEIQRRQTFLDVLDTLVHDDFYKTHLKERTQLHKIIEKELWLFGDEYDYNFGTSDQRLTTVLKEHLKICDLKNEEIENIKKNIDGKSSDLDTCLKKIPDLYLWKKFDSTNDKKTDNLIIELKAPKVSLGIGIIDQGEKIYTGITKANGLEINEKNKWKYYFVSTKITEDLKKRFQGGTEDQILRNYQNGNYIIACKKWKQIIDAARFKLNEIKKTLEIEISKEDKQNLIDEYLKEVDFEK